MPRKKISSRVPAKIPAASALETCDSESAKVKRKYGVKTRMAAITATSNAIDITDRTNPLNRLRDALESFTPSSVFNSAGIRRRRANRNAMMPAVMKARSKTRENGTRSDNSDGQCPAIQSRSEERRVGKECRS